MSPDKLYLLPSIPDEKIIPLIADPEHVRSDEDMQESSTYWHCREVRVAAGENFACLHHRRHEDVTHEEIARSSAGVIGWSFAEVRALDSFDPPLPATTANGIGSCAPISHEPTPDKITVARHLSDGAVRLKIGEGNAKVLDSLDVMDRGVGRIRQQTDCFIMTTDDEDP